MAGLIKPVGTKSAKGTLTFAAAHPGSAKQEIEKIDTLAGLLEPELSFFSSAASEETTETITWEKEVEIT